MDRIHPTADIRQPLIDELTTVAADIAATHAEIAERRDTADRATLTELRQQLADQRQHRNRLIVQATNSGFSYRAAGKFAGLGAPMVQRVRESYTDQSQAA